jgi:hypothetical protein
MTSSAIQAFDEPIFTKQNIVLLRASRLENSLKRFDVVVFIFLIQGFK